MMQDNLSQTKMNQEQMKTVICLAIEQLKEKNRYDCTTDDLVSQYEDNVLTYWKIYLGMNALLVAILFICMGYVLAIQNSSFLGIVFVGILWEGFVLYKAMRQYAYCQTIAACLKIILVESPDLLNAHSIQRILYENGR